MLCSFIVSIVASGFRIGCFGKKELHTNHVLLSRKITMA